MADWKDEARGIPVWVGAFAYAGADGPELVEEGDVESELYRRYASECLPALDNHDTQAAFLRRLALRLGCPEEVASAGVMFYAEPRSAYGTVAAGGLDDCGDWVWCRDVAPNVSDRLLALVRAWRSVG